MMELQLTRPAGLGHWLRLYRLYLTSFPRPERKPLSVILNMYRRGKTDVWCILEKGMFLGFAATLNGDGLIMLDYFAVEKRHRGRGVGTAALRGILKLYRDQGFFLEIERPTEDAPNRAEREKRKQFYLACGLQPLNVRANVFGISMELLGTNCSLDFPRYHAFYRDNYTPRALAHITEE